MTDYEELFLNMMVAAMGTVFGIVLSVGFLSLGCLIVSLVRDAILHFTSRVEAPKPAAYLHHR